MAKKSLKISLTVAPRNPLDLLKHRYGAFKALLFSAS